VLRRLVEWALVAAVWGLLAVAAVLGYFAWQLPPIDDLIQDSRRPGLTVLSRDGVLLANSGDVYGVPRRIEELPRHMPLAVVSIEDRRFFDHWGVDPVGLLRAVWVNRQAGRVVQGGSTLTQQVAKNVFLTPERTLKRKIQEVLLALWLEHRFTKAQILGIYLNRVYFGSGVYGVDAAAQRYFGKPATHLTLLESAVIAGMLKAPSKLNPAADPQRAATRAAVVLGAMVRDGRITEAEAEQAKAQAPQLARAAQKRPGRYFADWVLEQLPGILNPDRDLVVVTTLDAGLQRQIEEQANTLLASDGPARKVSQIAAIIMAPNGGVRALLGGRDYSTSQFNRATQARRQPGSSFKTLVLLAALEAGWQIDSGIEDAPITIGTWSPENNDGRYRGWVTLSDATIQSLNTAYVRLLRQIGTERVISLARRLGIASDLPNHLGLTLGTGEVSLIELASAYAAIANGGQGVVPWGILEVREPSGKVLWRWRDEGSGPVLDPAIVQAADQILRDVVRAGTGRNAALSGPAAGKTGTTQDFRDAWFLGYAGTPGQGVVGGVWMGNDDGTPMARVTGGDLPARFWRGMMRVAAP